MTATRNIGNRGFARSLIGLSIVTGVLATTALGVDTTKDGTAYYEKIYPSNVYDNNPSTGWIKCSDPSMVSEAGASWSFNIGTSGTFSGASIYYYTADGFFSAWGCTIFAWNFSTGDWDPLGQPGRQTSTSGTWSSSYAPVASPTAYRSSTGEVRVRVLTREYTHLFIRYVRVGYTVDSTPPTTPGTPDLATEDDTAGQSTSDNITYKTTGLTFSWSGSSDSGSGLAGYEWRLDSGSWSALITSTSVDISAGEGSHTFYVRAKDNAGNYSSPSSLVFTVDTTPPSIPSLSSPPNGANTETLRPTLSWSSVSGAWRYNLVVTDYDLIGAGDEDRWLTGMSFTYPYDMQEDTWYWKVRAEDVAGNQSNFSTERSFNVTVANAPKPINPSPSNGATSQPIEVTLSWQSGGGTTASYDVYFDGQFKGNQGSRSYNPGKLETGRTYTWRIDAKNSSGVVTTGDTWSFTTCGNSGPGPDRGNTTGQEYGDALYRVFSIFGYNYNHAGLQFGVDAAGVTRTVESVGGCYEIDDSTQEGYVESGFRNYGTNYYGAYIPASYGSTMPFADRRAVVEVGMRLKDAYIFYPYSFNADCNQYLPEAPYALVYRSGALDDGVVEVPEIYALRCDGVVEYAYERSGIRVWRNCLRPDGEWSIASYPDNHNNRPDGNRDPHYELSPWSQRGAPPATGPNMSGLYSGPPWPDTKMTKPSVVNLPTIEVTVQSVTLTSAIVRLRATDESGIWRISYQPPGSSTWVDRDNPLRHPDSDSWYVDVTLTSQGNLYVKAKDHGGNERQSGPYTITFPPQKAINPTPPNGSTRRPVNQQLSWQNGGGATSYDVYFNGEFKGNQPGTSYDPGILAYDTPYSWRIDAKNSAGTTRGDDWTFRTEPEPPRGTLQFSASSYSVAENAGSRIITVTRTGGSYGSASVNYSTANGTAVAGSDYTATSGTLYWGDGDTANKTFNVPIINDGTPESDETFTVTLSGAAGATLGSPSTATVTIQDDDQPTVDVTVDTEPSGLTIIVDGTTYTAPRTFTWDPGSIHTIGTTSPQSGAFGVRYEWSSWSDGGDISHTINPTVSGTYIAHFTTQYYLTMNASTGGTVSPSSGWHNSGAQVPITATPSSGYEFDRWTGIGNGSYSGTNRSASVTMNGPITQTASFIQLCTYTISPTNNPSVPAGGGSYSVSVTAGSGCSWAATSNVDWITITGGSSGSGNGTVSYSVAANTSTSSRDGTMTIAGQTFTVTQAGVDCTYGISPTSWTAPAGGGSTIVTVSTGSGCSWTVENSCQSWVTVTPSTGTGSESVNVSVTANNTGNQRACTVIIAGRGFEISQSPLRALTVQSSPCNEVSVGVSPADNSGQGGGSTPFTRTYNPSTMVTLTAPASACGSTFQKWQRYGVDYSTNATVTVTMDADYTLTAVFHTPKVAVPFITPSDGTFTNSVTVSLSTTTPGASIRYTITGNDPTESSALYVGPFVLTNSATVKARAYRTGYLPSDIATAALNVVPGFNGDFVATRGKYYGIVLATNAPTHATSGSLFLDLASNATFRATLNMGGQTARFIGTFNTLGRWTGSVTPLGGPSLNITLQLGVGQIEGTVSGPQGQAVLLAYRSPFNRTTNPCPWAGTYNLILQPTEMDPTIAPTGYGYGALVVTSDGTGRLRGSLADGTMFLAMGGVSSEGNFPLYSVLYRKAGALLGWVELLPDGAVEALLHWLKPANSTARYYPTGFQTMLDVMGARYFRPGPGSSGPAGAWLLSLGDGNLEDFLEAECMVDARGNATITDGGGVGLSLKIMPSSGQISGSFNHPNIGRRVTIRGLLHGPRKSGAGYFLGSDQGGWMMLDPSE